VSGRGQRGNWRDCIRAAKGDGATLAGRVHRHNAARPRRSRGPRRATTPHGAFADLAAAGSTVVRERGSSTTATCDLRWVTSGSILLCGWLNVSFRRVADVDPPLTWSGAQPSGALVRPLPRDRQGVRTEKSIPTTPVSWKRAPMREEPPAEYQAEEHRRRRRCRE